MAKPFFFRLQANDLAAEVMERNDSELAVWIKSLANDLLRADRDTAKTELGRRLIEEASNYKKMKAEAGKKGGKAKASSAKAKASSAKAKASSATDVLKQNVADPYPVTEAVTEAVAVQKQNKPKVYIFGELEKVKLQEGEHDKLIEKFGAVATDSLIQRLDGYLASTGKRYKSHYATMLNWARRDGVEKADNQQKPLIDPEHEAAIEKRRKEYGLC